MVSKSASKSSNTSNNTDARTAATDSSVAAQDIMGGVTINSTPDGAFEVLATGLGLSAEIAKAGLAQGDKVIDALAATREGGNSKLVMAIAAVAAVALIARG